MSGQKPIPNRSPPARILLESSTETTYYSPSTLSYSKKDKDKSSKGLWKSLKSKANVFSIFERGKPPQPPQQEQQRLQSCSPPPYIPLGAPINPEYEDEDEEDHKLKNENDRTYRRSCDEDRKKAAARITITTAEGEYDFAYRPRITVEHPSGSYQLTNDIDYANATQSTTALSAVSQKTDASDALLDFPDLGSDLAKYIRDGTPTPSASATPTEGAEPVYGFIPFDETIESYDDDFELNYDSPDGKATPKALKKRKSVRFASNDTDIAAKVAAEKAAEHHQQMYEQAKRAGLARKVIELKRDSISLLPKPASLIKTTNHATIPALERARTPSSTKTLRHQASKTFIAKRSPSPETSPLRQRGSMSFRSGRKESPTRTPRGFISPSKASLVQHTLTSPSKHDLSYVSPTKSVDRSTSPDKALPSLPSHMRSTTPPSPEKLTAENTRANTPTSPTKLGSIRSHTSTSPSKLPPARSHTPSSPTRKLTPYSPVVENFASAARSHSPASPKKVTPLRSHTPTTPITAIRLTQVHSTTPSRSPSPTKSTISAHDSMMRGKEAHEESARRKAIEVAEFKQQQQKLLTEKRVREDRLLREKRSEVALRRKASQGVLRDEVAPSQAQENPAMSRIPMAVPKATGSRLPVLKKKKSTAQMERPGVDAAVPSPRLAPVTARGTRAKLAPTVTARGVGTLKPKDSKQSLRPKASQSQLGSTGRPLPPKPAAKSKLGREMDRK